MLRQTSHSPWRIALRGNAVMPVNSLGYTAETKQAGLDRRRT